MKRFIQDQVALLVVPALLLLSAPAFGQSGECSSDDDCAEGQLCQKGMTAGGCTGTEPAPPDGAGAPEPADDCTAEPQVSETGYCYTPPTPCESDSECDEYLSCVESYGSGACTSDSEGNTTCSEPEEASVKYCSVASVACETDDECPRDFECIEVSACPAILCVEGDEECLDACEPSGEKYCNPQQIACEETADCPSAWSCVGNVVETCSGGATTPTDGTEPGVDPNSGDATDPPEPRDETICTTEAAVGFCQPDAYGGDGIAYANDGVLEAGVDEDNGNNTSADPLAPSGESASTGGGGCSVATGQQPVDFAWVLALLAALPLVRRRQSVS